MTKPRLTRNALATYVRRELRGFSFDPRLGWSQVDKASKAQNRDYGAYEALCRLADEFDLELEDRG